MNMAVLRINHCMVAQSPPAGTQDYLPGRKSRTETGLRWRCVLSTCTPSQLRAPLPFSKLSPKINTISADIVRRTSWQIHIAAWDELRFRCTNVIFTASLSQSHTWRREAAAEFAAEV
jgi:hypothetical protein